MKINKEGYRIIGVTGICCLAIWFFAYFFIDSWASFIWFMAALLLVFWFFVAAFFRRNIYIYRDLYLLHIRLLL